MFDNVKDSGQVEDAFVDSTKNVVLHTYKSGFTTMKSLVNRLKRLIEFVGFQVVLKTHSYNFLDDFRNSLKVCDWPIITKDFVV